MCIYIHIYEGLCMYIYVYKYQYLSDLYERNVSMLLHKYSHNDDDDDVYLDKRGVS
jgi:hypothetical protein